MGDFLQSEKWLAFQEATGHDVVRIVGGDFSLFGIVHSLPIVGNYLYTPRWPLVVNSKKSTTSEVIAEAKKRGCGWVRIEPETEKVLAEIKRAVKNCHPALDAGSRNSGFRFVKAPHDMQPRETLVMDIAPDEAALLAKMKSKTRYNVRLAEKKGVRVFATSDKKYRQAFVDLVTGTADRKGIAPHPRKYYEVMLQVLCGTASYAEYSSPAHSRPGEPFALRNVRSSDILSETLPAPIPNGAEKNDSAQMPFQNFFATLFVAEHEGDILGVNLMIFYGDTAIYLHGGSADMKRDLMAPYLLQWEAIKEAKCRGCVRYDFGGVHTEPTTNNSQLTTANKEQRADNEGHPTINKKEGWDAGGKSSIINHQSAISGWAGITKFKTGFAPDTEPTRFPGCYDVVLDGNRYSLYRFLQRIIRIKAALKKIFL